MAEPVILITGSNGQVGSELKKLAPDYPQYNFKFLTRRELPLDSLKGISDILENYKPEIIINCAAYTAVDKAESEPELAYDVNAKAVEVLAEYAASHNVKMLHLSTDYVYDGKFDSPIKESAPTAPLNVYGKTKKEGEERAIVKNKELVIIRTSWVYSAFGNNFVKTMLRLMNERKELKIVNDQWGSPTYAKDLASAILKIVGATWVPGLYHFSNEGSISWFQFAQTIKDLEKLPCTLIPITTEQYPTPAVRPRYTVMDKAKIRNDYNIIIRDWKLALEECLSVLRIK